MDTSPTPPPDPVDSKKPDLASCHLCCELRPQDSLLIFTCQTSTEHHVACCLPCSQTRSISCPFCASAKKVQPGTESVKEETEATSAERGKAGNGDKGEDAPQYCPNSGCPYWGKMPPHAPNCVYRQVSCHTPGCDASFPAVHAQQHVLECPFAVISCSRGGTQCPAFHRRESEAHDRVCVHFGCRVTPGCQTKCPLSLLGLHESSCRMLLGGWRSASEHLAQANAELVRLRAEVKSLQRDKDKMKEAMSSWWAMALRMQSQVNEQQQQQQQRHQQQPQAQVGH